MTLRLKTLPPALSENLHNPQEPRGSEPIYSTKRSNTAEGTMTHTDDLRNFLRDFEDGDLQRYTCFASEFRDQRMEAGSIAEAGFWNTVVNLCVDERMRRDQDIRRIEYMYRTGIDPEHHS
jgi:hypothetical protein